MKFYLNLFKLKMKMVIKMKNQSIFKNLLNNLAYKPKKQIDEFFIPQVNENGDKPIEQQRVDIGNAKNKQFKAQQDTKKTQADIPTSLVSNIAYIQAHFNYPQNKDIIIREFKIAKKYNAFIVYIDGMVDRTTINNFILRPLLTGDYTAANSQDCELNYIIENIIETNQANVITTLDDAMYQILLGDTGLFVDGCSFYIFSETKGYEKRNVDKPITEPVVKGPQEAFTENMRTNVTLLRKIIKNSNLTTEFLTMGNTNKNQCGIVYLNGVVNPAIVSEVKRRINGINTDFINGAGTLEQFIEDSPMSLLPTILSTERPDKAASHIMEGKIAIVPEGAPNVLIVPITLASMLHSAEETALRWQYGSFLRILRVFIAFVATMLPGIYIAITNFHKEMIPTELLIAIAKARENVPFPTIFEILLMEVSFELIREASIRVPGQMGSTIGIIGALIIGQAAVQADLVSPVLIIVIGFTGLGNFAIPDFSLAFGTRLIRLLFILAGTLLGFYGISLMFVALLTLLVDMRSFGVPFLSPSAPKTRKSYDAFLRYPVFNQESRPDFTNPLDLKRQPTISRTWTQENPEYTYDRSDDEP